MATFVKEDQNLQFQIPDNAEVFIHTGGPPYDEVFIRVGNKLYTVNFKAEGESKGFKGEEARTQGRQAVARALGYASWDVAEKNLSKQNLANAVTALDLRGQDSASTNVTLDQFLNLVKNTPTGGGDVTVNKEGQFSTTPATGQPRGTTTLGATGAGIQQFSPEQIQRVRNTFTNENQLLDQLLSDPNLTEDDKKAVRELFNIISSNDQDLANRFVEAFNTAAKISDPYFKQQARIFVDEIQRGFVRLEEDSFLREQQLRTRLSDLREDITRSREFLTLEQQQELKNLQRQFEINLENTREELAQRGLTFSTRRAEAEKLLEETTGEMRESVERRFGGQLAELQRQQERGERDTQSELERLRQLTERGKLDLARQAELELGSRGLEQLPQLGGVQPLGDITGEAERRRLQDALQFGSSFVF